MNLDKYTSKEQYEALGGRNWVQWITAQLDRISNTKKALVTKKINGDIVVTIGLKNHVIAGKDEQAAALFRRFLRENA